MDGGPETPITVSKSEQHFYDVSSPPAGHGGIQMAFQPDSPHSLVSPQLLLQVSSQNAKATCCWNNNSIRLRVHAAICIPCTGRLLFPSLQVWKCCGNIWAGWAPLQKLPNIRSSTKCEWLTVEPPNNGHAQGPRGGPVSEVICTECFVRRFVLLYRCIRIVVLGAGVLVYRILSLHWTGGARGTHEETHPGVFLMTLALCKHLSLLPPTHPPNVRRLHTHTCPPFLSRCIIVFAIIVQYSRLSFLLFIFIYLTAQS